MASWEPWRPPRERQRNRVRSWLRSHRAFGVDGYALKNISEASAIPLGNLYYYFKTRNELVLAVLDVCERELRSLLQPLAPLAPAAWLAACFEWLLTAPEAATRFGCPFGDTDSVYIRNTRKDTGCSSNSRNPHWVVLAPLRKFRKQDSIFWNPYQALSGQRFRPSEQVALKVRAACLCQQVRLLRSLDALGHRRQAIRGGQ